MLSPLANSSHSGAFNSRRSFGTWIICYTRRGRNYVASINHGVQSRATRLQRIFYNLLSYVGYSHLFRRPTIMTNQRRRILRVIAPAGYESQFSRRINLRPHRASIAERFEIARFRYGRSDARMSARALSRDSLQEFHRFLSHAKLM